MSSPANWVISSTEIEPWSKLHDRASLFVPWDQHWTTERILATLRVETASLDDYPEECLEARILCFDRSNIPVDPANKHIGRISKEGCVSTKRESFHLSVLQLTKKRQQPQNPPNGPFNREKCTFEHYFRTTCKKWTYFLQYVDRRPFGRLRTSPLPPLSY